MDPGSRFVITLDVYGHVLVAGEAVRDVNAMLDVAVLKYEPRGGLIWAYQVGTEYWDVTEGIATDASGNVFVIGSSRDNDYGSPFIAKLSAEGDVMWVRKPDVLQHSAGVAADPDGTAVLVTESGDIFKYAPNGDVLWQRRAGHYVGGRAVTINATGDVFVLMSTSAGAVLAQLSKDGEEIWEQEFDEEGPSPWKLALDPSGDFWILGDIVRERYLSRHAATGELLMSQLLDRNTLETTDDVKTDASGNVYVIGMANDFGKPHYDSYIGKFDPDGQLVWGQTLGLPGRLSRDLAVSPQGDVFVTGDLDSGAFVTRLSAP